MNAFIAFALLGLATSASAADPERELNLETVNWYSLSQEQSSTVVNHQTLIGLLKPFCVFASEKNKDCQNLKVAHKALNIELDRRQHVENGIFQMHHNEKGSDNFKKAAATVFFNGYDHELERAEAGVRK